MDDSDDELPSLDSLIPTKSGAEPTAASYRPVRCKSLPKLPSPPAFRKTPPMDSFMSKLAKEAEELRKREAQRAKLKALLDEDVSDLEMEEDAAASATDKALGKGTSSRLKAVLGRIGGDVPEMGGYRFFRGGAKEREFTAEWLKGVGWLRGFESIIRFCGSADFRRDDEE